MTASVETLWDQADKCSKRAEEFLVKRDQARIEILLEIIFHQKSLQGILKEIHELEYLADYLALGFCCSYNESQKIFPSDKKMANILAKIGHRSERDCQRINDRIKLLYFEISQLNASWKQLFTESDLWDKLAMEKIARAKNLRRQIEEIKLAACKAVACQ